MEKFTQEMNVINLQIAKCYKIYNELSIEDQMIVKEELPAFYHAMNHRDIILLDSKNINLFLEKNEPIFKRFKTLEDFRMLSNEQIDLFKKQDPEIYNETLLISNIEKEIIEMIEDFKGFDHVIKTFGSFRDLVDSAFMSANTQNPKISFKEAESNKLIQISKFILNLEQKSLEENVLEIQKLLFRELSFKEIIRLLVELSFYNFKYKKEIDVSYIQLIINFFMDLMEIIELTEYKLNFN